MHANSFAKALRRNACSRRHFLGYAGGALAAGAIGSSLAGAAPQSDSAAIQSGQTPEIAQPSLSWGNLLHLSFNMWLPYQPDLRFDDKLWEELTQRMADVGMNMIVIDLGDGVQYQSHPEIAVRSAWSAERLRNELARLRKLRLEPIPKFNLSTTHGGWLGPYARQVSSPIYYKVCEELIDEVIALFDKPRFFHLGMDEETVENQKDFDYIVVRQHELWWHDLEFFAKQVEQRGARPWIWSDSMWRHEADFLKRMSKNILQSNWYYDEEFKDTDVRVACFTRLEQHGYDQMPTGSNWTSPKSFGLLTAHCEKRISRSRLKGFLQTPWHPTLNQFRQKHLEAIDQVAAAMAHYGKAS